MREEIIRFILWIIAANITDSYFLLWVYLQSSSLGIFRCNKSQNLREMWLRLRQVISSWDFDQFRTLSPKLNLTTYRNQNIFFNSQNSVYHYHSSVFTDLSLTQVYQSLKFYNLISLLYDDVMLSTLWKRLS